MWRYLVFVFSSINLGFVENLISCDFEDGLCDWSDNSTTEYDWSINSGKTPDFTSGPPNDHTFDNYLGHYVFANGGRATKTSVAVLRSEEIKITRSVNLTFWYYMSGNGIGSMSLLRDEMNASVIWSKSGRQGFDWQHALVTLHPGNFKLAFKTKVVRPYGSDVAIDDIRLNSEPKILRTRPTPTTITTTTTGVSVSTTPAILTCPVHEGGLTLSGSCDFEAQKMCGYNSSKTDHLEWLREKGLRGSMFSTHIKGDGSVNGTGYYVFLRTDAADSATGKTATLTSPTLNKQTRVCLTFAYTIVSQQETTLRVYTVTSGSRVQLAAITDHEMTSWKTHNVSLCAEVNTRIVFEGIKVAYLGYIALDNFAMTSGICGHKYAVITTPAPDTTTMKRTKLPSSSSTAGVTTFNSLKTPISTTNTPRAPTSTSSSTTSTSSTTTTKTTITSTKVPRTTISTTIRVLTCPVHEGGLTLPGSCDFEGQKMCGYNSSKVGDLEWLRFKGYRGSIFGGHITGDHGNGTGYYVFLRTDGNSADGLQASLTSPDLNKQTGACLQFAYTIVSEAEVTLNVYTVTSGSRVHLAAIADHEMTSWGVYNVSLCAEKDTRIVFEAKKVAYLGYVVIDDIKVKSGLCGPKNEITTDTTMSSFTQSGATKEQSQTPTQGASDTASLEQSSAIVTTSGYISSNHVTKRTQRHHSTTPFEDRQSGGGLSDDNKLIIIIAVVVPSFVIIVLVVLFAVRKRSKSSEIPGSTSVQDVYITQTSYTTTTQM